MEMKMKKKIETEMKEKWNRNRIGIKEKDSRWF